MIRFLHEPALTPSPSSPIWWWTPSARPPGVLRRHPDWRVLRCGRNRQVRPRPVLGVLRRRRRQDQGAADLHAYDHLLAQIGGATEPDVARSRAQSASLARGRVSLRRRCAQARTGPLEVGSIRGLAAAGLASAPCAASTGAARPGELPRAAGARAAHRDLRRLPATVRARGGDRVRRAGGARRVRASSPAPSRRRHRVDARAGPPRAGPEPASFVFRLGYRDRSVPLVLRPGFVAAEFIDPARTEPPTPARNRG